MCPSLLISAPYCVSTLIVISTLALISSSIIFSDIIVRVHVHWDQVVHQAISKSRENYPFDWITESDVSEAAPESLVIDESHTWAIIFE